MEKKEENEIYDKYQDDMFEYETLEALEDESNQEDGDKKDFYSEANESGSGGNENAVSFLTGIILKKDRSSKQQHIEVKKIKIKQLGDGGLDDPNRKHQCNVCNKKFQKRSNLIGDFFFI